MRRRMHGRKKPHYENNQRDRRNSQYPVDVSPSEVNGDLGDNKCAYPNSNKSIASRDKPLKECSLSRARNLPHDTLPNGPPYTIAQTYEITDYKQGEEIPGETDQATENGCRYHAYEVNRFQS